MKKILLLVISCVSIVNLYAQDFKLQQRAGISIQTNVASAQNISFDVNNPNKFFDLNNHAQLKLVKIENDKIGYTHFRYVQLYDNIPVEKSMFAVHTKNAFLKSTTGTIVLDFSADMSKKSQPVITPQSAVKIALQKVNASEYAWQNAAMENMLKDEQKNLKATFYPSAELVWYNAGESLNPRALTLCYKIDVYALQPLSRKYYFIDALNGKIVGTEDRIYNSDATGTANTAYSGTQTIHSDFTGTSYRLRDMTKGNGVITLHGESGLRGQEYTSNSNNWNLTSFDQAAMDAHFGVEQTYSYYFTTFGRNSYDNNGTALYSYVNDPTYIDNAFWDGAAMNFNKRSTGAPGGVTGIDVCGHELTHGVTQSSCNLIYSYESGAINESLSDIMGKSVQFFAKPGDIDWRLSNDMNWFIRDMSNPNAYIQPDTYKGTYWYTGAGDNGGVHYNSGVGNFMFYLLVNGGSGTNDKGDAYSVSSIGLAKADQIIYRSQTVYLTTTSQYADWRNACILSASDLYGSSSNEVDQVKNAFYAVGIGSSATGCDVPIGLSVSNLTKNSATLNWVASGATGYNLQWKVATSTTWKTVSNIATNSYKVTGLLPGVSYNFKVEAICASGSTSGYSDTYTFTTIPVISYCPSYGTYTSYEYINRVAIGAKGYTSGNNNGYGNFINIVLGNLNKNGQYTLTLTPGFVSSTYPEDWTAYIDYNRNGKFDAGEMIGTAISTGAAPTSITFTVPAIAKNGLTDLRVQMSYNISQTNACAVYTYGETEDYAVNLKAAAINAIAENNIPAILLKPNPVSGNVVSAIVTANVSSNITLKVCDLSGRVLLTQQFYNCKQGENNLMIDNIDHLTQGVFMVTAEQNNIIIGRAQLVKN